MKQTYIAGAGHYVPENRVSNDDLCKFMDTSDEWIVERTGIRERRYGTKHEESTSTMGAEAARRAIEDAGMQPEEIDFIVFATLSPDYYFPGVGVLLQRQLGISAGGCGALDVRNQCSGFIYALSVADQFIKTGMYKNILVVGAEHHSMGLDFSTRGRNVTVIFGDGAGAMVLKVTEEKNKGIFSTHLHSDGREAEELAFISPGAHGGIHDEDVEQYGFPDSEWGDLFITQKMLDEGKIFPHMNGKHVFKYAVSKFPEVILEALDQSDFELSDLDMLIPHQANLRISQFVQKKLQLRDNQVFNNIQKYGNTTAASIPLAFSEAVQEGKIARGDLVCLAAFGSGFTWGSALLRY